MGKLPPVDSWYAVALKLKLQCDTLDRENRRLDALVGDLADVQAERDALRAEVERLRAALREITTLIEYETDDVSGPPDPDLLWQIRASIGRTLSEVPHAEP